ncbi:SdpI family protein [Spirosoma endophyticum]
MLTILFIPTSILILAVILYYRQPKEINFWYGYRTGFSMKNKDTWSVANRISAVCLLYTTLVFETLLILIILILRKAGLIEWFGSIKSFFFVVAGFSTALVLIPIIVTEYKLTKIFTSNGERR